MTETEPEEETEAEQDEVEEDTDEENTMMQKRISVLLLVIGGVSAALITDSMMAFDQLSGLLPVIPISLITIVVLKYLLNTFSSKTVPFVILITTVMWFITGTFILQI